MRKISSLLEQDALKLDFENLRQAFSKKDSKFKLVANLPYYISTAILQKLIEQRENFSEMILMFQREVVDRITAETGNKERGFLTIIVEKYLETEKLFDVPPNAFKPAPKVWSSIVRLTNVAEIKSDSEKENKFRELISVSFKQKRKTLINNLTGDQNFLLKHSIDKNELLQFLDNLQINPSRRAESLNIDEWNKLNDSLNRII